MKYPDNVPSVPVYPGLSMRKPALKGYMFKNLQGAFDRYLPPLRIGSAAKSKSAVPSATEFPSIFNDLSA